MKKYTKYLLITCIAFLVMFSFAAINANAKCKHSYKTVTTYKNVNSKEHHLVYKMKKCSKCGAIKDKKQCGYYSHNLRDYNQKYKKCALCGYKYKKY